VFLIILSTQQAHRDAYHKRLFPTIINILNLETHHFNRAIISN